MDRLPPPLLGFNNNVQHNGRTFHIQTEDSGLKYCRVVTHLFADGGRILQTRRTDYAGQIGEPDLIEQIRLLMKSQHRSMFTALRAGDFDEMIRSTFEGPTQAEVDAATSPTSQRAQLRPEQLPPLSMRVSEEPKAAAKKTEPPAKRPSSRPKRSSSRPAPSRRAEPSGNPSQPAVAGPSNATSLLLTAPKPRPTMASNNSARRQPNGGSIFGDNTASEQSLDDVILSYLEDDAIEPPGRSK